MPFRLSWEKLHISPNKNRLDGFRLGEDATHFIFEVRCTLNDNTFNVSCHFWLPQV